MITEEKDIIECIPSEVEDGFSDDSLFSISSWGADLSFREIIEMYKENELIKPEMQRHYVWDKFEASRFIESILMGLPVPSVFFAKEGTQKLIVDGYQRIMTVNDYVNGKFSTDGKVFRLSNTERINERWRNKAFVELSIDDQRTIKSTTIHTIIFEQRKPENNSASLFQIFERINTSGRTLNAQEIRNCINQGAFNSLLVELNNDKTWRVLFGTRTPDSRMRDVEFILRFLVMKDDVIQKTPLNQISLKKTLNEFMSANRNASVTRLNTWRNEFLGTMENVYRRLGKNAFRNHKNGKVSSKFHPAVFDAISVAFYQRSETGIASEPISELKFANLFNREDFQNAISVRTTDIENINKRIRIAKDMLFEVGTNET